MKFLTALAALSKLPVLLRITFFNSPERIEQLLHTGSGAGSGSGFGSTSGLELLLEPPEL